MSEPALVFYCDRKRHLVCSPFSVENLHKMAAQLGIKRCWYHSGKRKHYDIPKRRVEEIMAQCTVISTQMLLEIAKHG